MEFNFMQAHPYLTTVMFIAIVVAFEHCFSLTIKAWNLTVKQITESGTEHETTCPCDRDATSRMPAKDLRKPN